MESSTIHCGNYQVRADVENFGACSLLPGIDFLAASLHGSICESCKPHWIDGRQPATRDELPRQVVDLVEFHPLAAPAEVRDFPHPDHCDRMERPLPPFEGCCDQRLWLCSIHGEVRLSDCQRGEKGCGDFRRHDTPPDGI